jgi:xylulokinase
MVETDGATLDMDGNANAMYDALDRPFMFGCRTNGALRWDGVRAQYGMEKGEYARAEEALRDAPAANKGRLFLWQIEKESFPISGAFGPVRIGYEVGDFAADYAGIVESSLAAVYLHSRQFMTPDDTLYVAGGPASGPQILRRVAAIWNRQVVSVEGGGAALGAAVSGAYALLKSEGAAPEATDFTASFMRTRAPVKPLAADVAAYHGENGYLKKYALAERGLTGLL